jgi:signal-transduction protein with cAMP-binding, CBS, and nucleotidyltransferase domain
MDRYDVGSVLIKRGTELLGIVTEADFVRRVVLEGHSKDAQVSTIMTRDLVTISPGMDVFDALQLMKDADVKHLPVVDNDKLVGFVTLKDLLKIQPALFDDVVDTIRLREEKRKLHGSRTVREEDLSD